MKVEQAGDYLEVATPAGTTIRVLRRSHPRARRLRLTVSSSGPRLTYPAGTHPAQVQAFLRKHGEWLERKLGELRLAEVPEPLRPGGGTVFSLRGEPTRIVWRSGAWPQVELEDARLTLRLPHPHDPRSLATGQALLRSFLEARLRRDAGRCIARHAPLLGRGPNGLRVRPLKSLWGSLDARDWITLDLALALAPSAALRYVVIHELCHLRVRSHSPRFWALVARHCPQADEQRAWLRGHGQALKAELDRLLGPA